MTSPQTIQQSKRKKWVIFLLKLSFTFLICGVAVWQVKNYFSSVEIIAIITNSFVEHAYLLGLMLLMSFLNWGSEAGKWLIVLPKESKVNFFQAFRSVLIGLGMSLLLPRLAGESIGRYSSHHGNKKDVVSALVLTKIFQSIVTFGFGIMGIFYFSSQLTNWFHLPDFTLLSIVIIGNLLLFIFKKKIKKLLINSPYFESFRQMNITKGFQLFSLSTFRYLTFFGQVSIMTLFVSIQVDFTQLFFALAALYLIRMATISVNVVVDLGVRFATALLLFSTLKIIPDPNMVIVIFSLVWLFNVILPSLSGGLLILKNK